MKKPTKAAKPPTEQAVREYLAAMSELVQDSRFAAFIDALRSDRENAMLELGRYDVVADERLTLAHIGTINAYTDIIARYDEALNQLRAARAEEDAAAGG